MEKIYLKFRDTNTTTTQQFDVTPIFEETVEIAVKQTIRQLTEGDKS